MACGEEQARRGRRVDLHTILPSQILYVEWQNRGAGANHILCNIDFKIQGGGVAMDEVMDADKG